MADLDRVALVSCTFADGTSSVGTGYLIDARRVLTASHVVHAAAGVGELRVRLEADQSWHDAEHAWHDPELDAAVLRLAPGLPGVAPIEWIERAPAEDVAWESSAFPVAAFVRKKKGASWKTKGLRGTLYRGGGGGQGPQELDLGVENPPAEAELWSGASGAPVIVGGRLAGLITQVPPNFRGERLVGLPAASLLQSPRFRLAIAEPWLALETLPRAQAWVLVVLSEGEDAELGRWVDKTLENNKNTLREVIDPSFELESVQVKIADAMRSPAHWLSLVQALCVAPIAVFDATDFEPAVMLALGVRAVVRRGVTMTSTARELTPEVLGRLPFNIKETKLIHHGDSYEFGDERHPTKAIAAGIKRGWQESRSQPRYLDLPAYDGVRCPHPAASEGDVGAVERILMLCPFAADYARNWRALSSALALRYVSRYPARMLDLASPRLVGQALYEGIRWARTCVIDWTGWRANVFFEFGARLACSNIGPVCLIDAADPYVEGDDALPQRRRLLEMWGPTVYRVSQDDNPKVTAENRRELSAAFDAHDAIAADRAPPMPLTRVPHDATYITCRDHFAWVQEGLTIEPQEFLRRSVIDPYGPDPQKEGVQPILYAAMNPDYSVALAASIRERWLAAWYYVEHRYPPNLWAADPALREKVKTLANQVLQFGAPKDDPDPHLQSLRETIAKVIDTIDDLDP